MADTIAVPETAVYSVPDNAAPATHTTAVHQPSVVNNATTQETTTVRAEDHTLARLYSHASDLEQELAREVRHPDHRLTAAQIGRFNQILADAKSLLPNSKTLATAVTDVGETTIPRDAWHMLHVELVPTLHNALPTDDYKKTG